MNGEEAMELINDLEDAETMSKTLISKAMEKPKCTDNITVIVILL